MPRNLFNAIIALTVLVIVTACACPSDRDKGTSGADSPQNRTTASDGTANAKNPDKGDFIVEYIAVKNSKYEEIDKQIKQEKLLENAASRLNRALALPHDLTLRSRDCGEINAFYNPQDQSVTVCYELMEHFFKLFQSGKMTEQQAYNKMFDAVQFVFLHEIGHALIDTYKLPVMGNEEDAADRCAAYINLEELGDAGVSAALAAADAFALESKNNAPTGRQLADEHLLGEQRFYNTLCMIYGNNPDKWEKFVTEGYLPQERAVRCSSEYSRNVQSWIDLLKPWRKRGN